MSLKALSAAQLSDGLVPWREQAVVSEEQKRSTQKLSCSYDCVFLKEPRMHFQIAERNRAWAFQSQVMVQSLVFSNIGIITPTPIYA